MGAYTWAQRVIQEQCGSLEERWGREQEDAAWHVVGGSEGEGECSLFLSETVNGNRLEALSY